MNTCPPRPMPSAGRSSASSPAPATLGRPGSELPSTPRLRPSESRENTSWYFPPQRHRLSLAFRSTCLSESRSVDHIAGLIYIDVPARAEITVSPRPPIFLAHEAELRLSHPS